MEAMAQRRRNRIAPIAGAFGADKSRAARAVPARSSLRRSAECLYRRLLLIYVRRVSFLMSP
jgi:hypothetical protein